jgi:isoamylase
VDGFRFDLATVLGREHYGYDRGSGFLDALHQDPTLAAVKFIAEPWDIGPGGYQLGNFPPGWSEWNDRYRDTVRRFWRGDSGMLPEFARRVHGSSDIFEHSGRRPSASINFITSHDGFTLQDLVSYRDKHNETNLEDNRDGHSENYSENYGVEGPTLIEEINDIRRRQQRNLLATLVLSQGTPLLNAGDEFSRSQQGNNNAYCQDSPLSWLPWDRLDPEQMQMLEFVRHLLGIKGAHAAICQDFYIHDSGDPDAPAILWYNISGELMQPVHWGQHHMKTLGYMVVMTVDPGTRDHYLTLFNAGSSAQQFRLPTLTAITDWLVLLDTCSEDGRPQADAARINGHYAMQPYTTVLLHTRTVTVHKHPGDLF